MRPIIAIALAVGLVACSQPTPVVEVREIERPVTVAVVQTVEVPVTVPALETQEVPVTVEIPVAVEIPVTREVLITVEVPQTVIVTATPLPTVTGTPTSEPTPTPTIEIVMTLQPSRVPVRLKPTAPPTEELAVQFRDPHYECVRGCIGSGESALWTYRWFQVKLGIRNLATDKAVDWNWVPSRWFITDGYNVHVETKGYEWGDGSTRFEKPVLRPGATAEWTFILAPINRDEWVCAVEFEAWGQLYRTEFDLGPYGNAYDYEDCGDPLWKQGLKDGQPDYRKCQSNPSLTTLPQW